MQFSNKYYIIKKGGYMNINDITGSFIKECKEKAYLNYIKRQEIKRRSNMIPLYDLIIYNLSYTDPEDLLIAIGRNLLIFDIITSKEKSIQIYSELYGKYCVFAKKKTDEAKDAFLNDVNELKEAVIRLKQIKVNKLTVLKNEVEEEKDFILASKYLGHNLKNNFYISDFIKTNINKYMESTKKSDQYKIAINEKIRLHNQKINGRKSISYIEQAINDDTIIYDITQEEERKFDSLLNGIAVSYAGNIINCSKEELDSLPKILEEIDSGYTTEQLNYFYKKILNIIVSELTSYKDRLANFSIYQDIDYRNLCIMEYNSLYGKYQFVKNYYEELIDIIELDNEEEQNIIEEDTDNKSITQNISKSNIIFLTDSDGTPLIQKDLDDIVPEYYGTIKELLVSKTDGTISPKKEEKMSSSNRKFKDVFKLKHDQVRILCKPLGDNNFLVMGAIEVKKMKKKREYETVVRRYNKSNFDENVTAEMIENHKKMLDDLINYLEKNKRAKFR